MPEPFLSIVIPAYNEARRLPDTLRNMETYLKKLGKEYEILVVDDGSSDNTATIVKIWQQEIPSLKLIPVLKNRGKGHAVKLGMLRAEAQYILMSDADLSTPIEELDRFLPLLKEGFAVVIGTRKHQEARILQRQPRWRESMGKAFTWISNIVLGLHISDFTCGFKAFDRKAAKDIFAKQIIDRWAFDSEILYLANRSGYMIAEVPVRWANSPETKVRIIRDTIESFLSLFQIRLNRVRGKYD